MTLLEDIQDGGLEFFLRIRGLKPGLVIEERGAGKTRHLKRNRKREISLEGDESLNLHRRFYVWQAGETGAGADQVVAEGGFGDPPASPLPSVVLAAGEACGAVADGGLSALGQGPGNSQRKSAMN
ncbi:hypothetical protein [Arthrobacter sp. OV608]|uniref:hypothetical protein n=1 Tax=Arthrobacter sp. OV608 TaxID=1882768 RepID=UPI002570C1E7|nr:hypothetical protein [Arthrobacter sp. OV608]